MTSQTSPSMDQELRQSIDRGREAFERRNYAEALAIFRDVLKDHPDFADIRHLAGLCLGFLGQSEAALTEFDHALSLNSQYVEAHLNRAIILNELGRFEEARTAFEAAGRLGADADGPFPPLISARLANAHAVLGDLYLEAGAPISAAEQYRTALVMRPLFHDIRNKLAQALMQLGDLEPAARELETALDGNQRFLAARLNLGLIYFRLGRTADARAQWEICREQQPGNPQARAYLAMVERRPQPPAAG